MSPEKKRSATKFSVEIETADVLSDALNALELRSRIFCRSELTAPWALAVAAGEYAHFHLMSDGAGWLHMPDRRPPIELSAGDLVVLPHGKGHVLSASRDRESAPLIDLAKVKWRSGVTLVRNGGRGPATRIICGSFQSRRRPGTSLLLQLPDVLHLRGRGGRPPEWLASISRLLTVEAIQSRLGRSAVMTRLTDVMLMQVLRHWIEASPDQRGWLVALRDNRIGAALSLIRKDLGRAWTVERLAKHVAMSRSAFAARFASLLGEPPLRYIARWRMLSAADLLRNGKLPLEQIASDLGYATTAAFHKAFKRAYRTTPGAYRERSGRE